MFIVYVLIGGLVFIVGFIFGVLLSVASHEDDIHQEYMEDLRG